jgi:hypothetical protein
VSTARLPGTTLPTTETLYDEDGNPVAVARASDGSYALAADPRLLAKLDGISERLDRLIEIGDLVQALLVSKL